MLGPQAGTGPDLENRFTRKDVETMAYRYGPPAKFDGRGLGISQPVGFPMTLHLDQVLLDRQVPPPVRSRPPPTCSMRARLFPLPHVSSISIHSAALDPYVDPYSVTM